MHVYINLYKIDGTTQLTSLEEKYRSLLEKYTAYCIQHTVSDMSIFYRYEKQMIVLCAFRKRKKTYWKYSNDK